MPFSSTSTTLFRHLPITQQCRRAAIARYYSGSSASGLGPSGTSRTVWVATTTVEFGSSSPSPTSASTTARRLTSSNARKSQSVWTKRTFSTSSRNRDSGKTHPDPLEVNLTDGEETIYKKLTERFAPGQLKVQDVSGGCGTFYAIVLSSKEFAGKSIVQQHKLVQETIKEEIEGIHGLQIKTIPE